jgi:tetratricopeptide (TPR) repeat protein
MKVYVDNGSGPQEVYPGNGSSNPAWYALKKGKYDIAMDYFASEAEKAPKSGLPISGYALSTASLGNLDLATKLMRKALRTDPGAFRINPTSLRHLQLNKKIRVLIDNLISQYSLPQKTTDLNHAFMLSVLNYLKHDYTYAKKFLDVARQDGDTSPSHINLEELIVLQLKGQENKVTTLAEILNE